ncbi:protein Spindly-like [Schistocerca gregaria]|uniref:protein Spindly-like n=1 Tax=Schistocerca gregaria TaxID=7010 RepID=UPI00211F3F4C|nr:protein Spindly-like [Schistocerca gregaria]
MFVILLCILLLIAITLYRKSVLLLPEEKMEERQQEIHKLHRDIEVAESMKREMQDVIKYLEMEKMEKNKRLTITKKKHELELSRLTGKIVELESTIHELQEVISDLKPASIKDAGDQRISVTTNNSEELVRLQAEKQEAENAYLLLQNTYKEFQTQNTHLENVRNELLTQISELQSKLALKIDEYNASKENVEALQEQNALMKVELETLKAKVNTHSSKGNSLFAEVEDGRQQLENQIKKQKVQLLALQKRHLQTFLTFRKLLKEKARLCEDLAQTKEQVSTKELQLQLTAYKERLKDLETAQRAWVEEKAALPIVLGNNYESVKTFDRLVEKEREKTKKIWERYEDIMMRYIAMTDEVVALKSETGVTERMRLRAEEEIVKLKQEIEKKGEGDHKEEDLIPVVESSLPQEIQNKKKCRFAPETIEPSSKKLVAKKETNKIPYLTSS